MTAQELKNSILQLAVQGKLVPQNADDEPAAELLKRIQIEKTIAVNAGIIKKDKKLSEITEAEIPYDIPDTWEWLRLGQLCQLLDGEKKSGVKCPYLEAKYLRGKIEGSILESGKFVKKGTRLILVDGENSGEVFFATEDGYMGSTFKVLYIPDAIYAPYVLNFLLLKKQLFRNRKTGAAIPHLNKELFFNLLIPIPPLAEQERIVAKIEELLPLAAEYDEAEQRLSALNTNFPEMLRKSILQQAVQGKLTARDPSDEPASELLKRIQAEKAKLIAEGKIKKEKPLPPITEDDCPFEIPDTWKWVRLGDIVRYQGGYAYKSDTYVKQSGNQVVRLGNVKNNALPLSVSPVYIPDHIAEETEDYRITEDTILFTMTGTKGKRDYFYTCRIKEENLPGCKLYLNQRVGCLSAYSNIELDWLTIVLQSEPILSQIFATATGNANQANIGSVNTLKLLIPLPPLAEQKRIVARVEELLADCDMLKSVH